MNYIELINNFWLLNKGHSFSSNEGMLYFALLDICNSLGWKNPFNQSNRNLAAQCNMSEKTLIKARNYLKEVGLIDFQSEVGRRNHTIYELKYCKIYSILGSISDSISGSISGKNQPPLNDIYSNPPNYTKLNKTKLKKSPNGDTKNPPENPQIFGNPETTKIPEIPELTEIQKRFNDFQVWIDEYTPRVAKMEKPFMMSEFEKLIADFDINAITEMLKSMHNYKPLLKKNVSANLTFRKWITKEMSEK